MGQNEHEVGFVNSFMVPERRARALELLGQPKTRRKQLQRLDHSPDLDARFCTRITPGRQSQADIEDLLRKRGAPDKAYILSSHPKLDAQQLPLREALASVVGFGFGSVISCVPGRLAYYEGESAGERYVLERNAG
jgi:hypothetical protein